MKFSIESSRDKKNKTYTLRQNHTTKIKNSFTP